MISHPIKGTSINNGRFACELAWYKLSNGDNNYDEVLDLLLKTHDLNPNSAYSSRIFKKLGIIKWLMGNYDEALENWRSAM